MASNDYCGPFAVAYALGVSTGEAARRLRALTGKRAIFGVAVPAMHGALADRAIRVLAWPHGPSRWPSQQPPSYFNAHTFGLAQPTLRQFAEAFGGEGRLYVLAIPGHYMVLDGFRLYDNNGSALVMDYYRKRAHVQIAWHIQRAQE